MRTPPSASCHQKGLQADTFDSYRTVLMRQPDLFLQTFRNISSTDTGKLQRMSEDRARLTPGPVETENGNVVIFRCYWGKRV